MWYGTCTMWVPRQFVSCQTKQEKNWSKWKNQMKRQEKKQACWNEERDEERWEREGKNINTSPNVKHICLMLWTENERSVCYRFIIIKACAIQNWCLRFIVEWTRARYHLMMFGEFSIQANSFLQFRYAWHDLRECIKWAKGKGTRI